MTVVATDQNFDNLISRQEQRILLVLLQKDDVTILDELGR